ncbi:MAG: NfeD family protein [Thermodesulfobacteriota bacterium]
MDGLFVFIPILLIVILVLGAIWGLLQVGIVDGLNWFFRKIGLSSSQKSPRKIGRVLSPFSSVDQKKVARGKVFFQGEIWNAYCDADLAQKLKMNDKVEITQNVDLSMTVMNKLN